MSTKFQTKIGLGTFPFTGTFSPIDEDTVENIIMQFIQLEGTYIDNAPTYAFGEIESMVGRIIKKNNVRRDKVYLATMCGHKLDENNKFVKSGRYEDVIKSCEGSMRRLQVDHLDLFMSHTVDLNTPFEETISAMTELRKQGKIKEIGVSNVTLEQLKEYNKTKAINFVENRFSLLNRNFSDEFVQYCSNNNIGIIAFQVLERSLLTDKAITGINLRDGDLRTKKPEFADEIRAVIGIWSRENLKPIADSLKVPLSALSLWWATQQPGISICLAGATNANQMKDNMRLLKIHNIPPHIINQINESYSKLEEQIEKNYSKSVRSFMGLDATNVFKSASGKI
jgi:aryl-alcohol dehydrogenase-like predicted oxidoreductase